MSSPTTTYEGLTIANFSQATLDLQKESFCCTDKDQRKLIRWSGCKPSVFKSNQTLFSSSDLAFCSWYQEVGTYNFSTIELISGATASVNLDSKYALVKINWPKDSLESRKIIEIGIGEQPGYVGSSIPFTIGGPTATSFKHFIIKDVFHMNTEADLTTPIRFNNISEYDATVSILYAN